MFCKKGVLKNFVKFTGKHLCQSLFFSSACSFIEKETLAQVFSCELCEIFLYKHFFYRTHTVTAFEMINLSILVKAYSGTPSYKN